MDQHSASTLMIDSSTAPMSSEGMSPVVSVSVDDADIADETNGTHADIIRQHPIPPASEPMQYRAIGLVRGKYIPSQEQFTRGCLVTDEELPIDAVLLGRVMSLVKKHLDLEQNHLWVVYPRTREKDNALHVQIVGVWEPEKLNRVSSDASEETPESDISESNNGPDLEDGYFSIRGEILFHSVEDSRLIVKIQQSPRKGALQGKSFKLNLQGTVDGKSVGYFWELNVHRQGQALSVKDGKMIALVPPKKRKTKKSFVNDKKKRRGNYGPPQVAAPSNRPSAATPLTRKPAPKPIKKAKEHSDLSNNPQQSD
jgi:hypothetical protein